MFNTSRNFNFDIFLNWRRKYKLIYRTDKKLLETMPQHQSAKKRVRQNEKRRVRNQAKRSKMKTLINKALETTDKEEAEKAFKEASSYLDKMAAKDLIHQNFAARKKSKIADHVNSL